MAAAETIGRYEIIRQIGAGSQGTVYLAEDPYIDRQVSIKISTYHEPVSDTQPGNYSQQFFHEARSAGQEYGLT